MRCPQLFSCQHFYVAMTRFTEDSFHFIHVATVRAK